MADSPDHDPLFEADGPEPTASMPRKKVAGTSENIPGDPPETASLPSTQCAPSGSTLPEAIGSYRVLRLLGEGGMGRVYQCEQANPRRQVAVKMMSSHFTPDGLRRFQLEAETLARLQHPGIAQIFEAGTATVGGEGGPRQPFIAMELVKGKPILSRNLADWNIREKVSLLVQICQAVEHAHQNGVIHRDLKPGNILVGLDRLPRILDFGLARQVEPGGGNEAGLTETGRILGTLAYMSPEQASGDPLAVDSRSDVYALGVVAYELLSGRLPIAISRQSLPESLTAIREHKPARLGKLHPACRGDLETIVDRALEKDKQQRYQSVAELRGDLERYLDKRPIIARPTSVARHLYLFAQRHRALVTAAATTLATIVVSLIMVSLLLVQARKANATITTRNRQLDESRQQTEAAHLEALRRLGETYVLSARIAARRGQWRDALTFYEQALAMRPPDDVPLRIERIRLLATVGNRTAVRQELKVLPSPLKPPHQALVDLLQGELLLAEWTDPDPAEMLIRQAIESNALEGAELEYAQGLLCENAVEAHQRFHNALGANPFHQQARVQFVYMSILLGFHDQAREQLAYAQLLFPDDETLEALAAMLDLLEGKPDRAIARARGLEPKIGPRQTEAVVSMIEALGPLVAVAAEFEDVNWSTLMSSYGKLMGTLSSYPDVFAAPTGSEALLSVPNHPVLRHWVTWARGLVLTVPFGRYARIAEATEQLCERNPLDVLFALRAACHLAIASQGERNPGNLAGRAEAEQASQLYQQAIAAPSLLPSLKQQIKMLSVNADLTLMDFLPQGEQAYLDCRQRTRENVRRFSQGDDLPLRLLSFYAEAAFLLDDHQTARWLLWQWHERDAENSRPLQILAAVEGQLRNFSHALELTDRVLAGDPGNELARELRGNLVEALRKQAAAFEE